MTYKTHAAIGTGVSTLLIHTNDIKVIVGGSLLAVVGALIVDIDTSKSKAASYFRAILCWLALFVIIDTIVKMKFNINILNFILQKQEVKQQVPALISLFILLVAGAMSRHRYFTHSIPVFAAFTFTIYMLVGSLYIWFAIGYSMHVLVDLLNKKEVYLLFPLKKGFCLGLCKSNGTVDHALFIIFAGITAIQYNEFLNSMF